MLDRLMGRAVFAKADRVMGQHVDDAHAHQRGQTDRRTVVVAEHQEGAAIGDETAMERDAVHGRGHAEFADAIVDVAAAKAIRLDRRGALGVGQVGMGQVGRAAEQVRRSGNQRVDGELRGLTGGDVRLVGRKLLDQALERGAIAGGELAGERILERRALAGVERREPLVPGFARRLAAAARRAPLVENGLRNFERRIGPVQRGAGLFDFLGAERRAMDLFRAGAVRRAVADGGAARDQRRPVAGLGLLDRSRDRFGVMAVDAAGGPAGRRKARKLVVRARQRGVAVDRDVIVVPQHDQPVELEMAGQRNRLVTDALHQAAVAGDHIGLVIDDVVAEPLVHQPLGQRHADRGGKALPQRTGGGFDALGVAVFRMARGLRSPLPERLDLIDRDVLVAGQIEQRVQQHRAVAGRQHEAVAIGPLGSCGIELQEAREQHGGHVRHSHRHAGMPGLGLFDGVDRQKADCIRHLAVRNGLVGLRGLRRDVQKCLPGKLGNDRAAGQRSARDELKSADHAALTWRRACVRSAA